MSCHVTCRPALFRLLPLPTGAPLYPCEISRVCRIWGLTTDKSALAAHLAIDKGLNAQEVIGQERGDREGVVVARGGAEGGGLRKKKRIGIGEKHQKLVLIGSPSCYGEDKGMVQFLRDDAAGGLYIFPLTLRLDYLVIVALYLYLVVAVLYLYVVSVVLYINIICRSLS